MGGGSGGGGTTTNINRTEPDPFTQQWRSQLFDAAIDQYNQGMPGYYPGQSVVPFSDPTQAGLQYMQDYASQGPFGLAQAQGSLDRTFSGWRPGMDTLAQGADGGMMNPFTGATAAQGLRQTTAGMDTLQATARGDMIGQNPYLQQMYDSGARQVANGVNAQFAQGGRFGSNAHSEGLSNGLGNLYSSIYAPAYAQERQNQLGAANSLGGFQAQDLSRGLQGLGMAGQFMSDDYGRQVTSAGALANVANTANQQGLTGISQLGSLYNYGLQPGQTMLDIGGAYEGLAGDYLQDAMTRYNYAANAGRSNVGWLADMMNGLPAGQNSSGSGTVPNQPRNRTMTGLGGAATGASMGSYFGPWGAAIGGIGGGLLGAFG